MTRRPCIAHSAVGISLVEVMVAVAVAVVLAAVITPLGFSWIDEGRTARAHNDAAAVSVAMSRFFQDTTKWPGQVEILANNSDFRFLTVGDPEVVPFPEIAAEVGITDATCVNGLSGVVPGETTFAATPPSAENSLNILDFLVTPPSAANYPNWKGPYLTVDVTSDPWERVYVVNVIPLFCTEAITAASPGGSLGFGWVISAGSNRTLQTPFDGMRLPADADDVGVTLGKRVVQAGT